MQIRTLFIGLAALSMALVGAYFSIYGLTALFAGAGTTITVMAAVMEFSKLVTASFLYLYWKRIALTMKLYLTTAVTILVFITSIGIYGFLTSAFETSNQEIEMMNRRVEVLQDRKDRYDRRAEEAQREAERLDETIASLSEGLSGNTIQYVDQETGQLVTTTSSATRNVLTEQLNDARDRRNQLTTRVDAYTDSVMTIDERIFLQRSSTDTAAEIGPLQFISDVSDLPISAVVNILALLITVSFDPLAISLVVAFNMSLYYSKIDDTVSEVDVKDDGPENENLSGIDESKGSYIPQPPIVTPTEPEKSTEEELKHRYQLISKILQTNESESIYDEDGPLKIDDDSNEKVAETASQEVKPIKDPLVQNKRPAINYEVPQHAPVKIDGTVVGYDTNGDGTVDRWSTNSKRLKYQNIDPYYAKSNYDWKGDDRWKSDQAAVNYWIRNVKNKPSRYPDNFNSKTY